MQLGGVAGGAGRAAVELLRGRAVQGEAQRAGRPCHAAKQVPLGMEWGCWLA